MVDETKTGEDTIPNRGGISPTEFPNADNKGVQSARSHSFSFHGDGLNELSQSRDASPISRLEFKAIVFQLAKSKSREFVHCTFNLEANLEVLFSSSLRLATNCIIS